MDQYKCPTGRQGRVVAATMNRRHRALTLWGLRHVDIEFNYVILDVGCGGGRTVNRLAQRAVQGKVFGIDYSADMVKYSKEVNRKLIAQNRVEVIEGSAEKTGLPDDFFDLVTAIETYYFWPSLYEVENAELIEKTQVHLFTLQEIQDVLQSTGFVDVQIFTKAKSPWNAILAKKPKQR
jgi:SAM-dependent methyltransferase